jgi:hypothetical protein
MRSKRKTLHAEELKQARIAIARWERYAIDGISWDDWVAAEVNGMVAKKGIKMREITGRMIRGWVEKEELKPPAERRRKGA